MRRTLRRRLNSCSEVERHKPGRRYAIQRIHIER